MGSPPGSTGWLPALKTLHFSRSCRFHSWRKARPHRHLAPKHTLPCVDQWLHLDAAAQPDSLDSRNTIVLNTCLNSVEHNIVEHMFEYFKCLNPSLSCLLTLSLPRATRRMQKRCRCLKSVREPRPFMTIQSSLKSRVAKVVALSCSACAFWRRAKRMVSDMHRPRG